jgi:spore maturation protein CgeB
LFEALISGAVVMTDRMLSLPLGLKNGTSILEFSSADELRSMIEYYLKHTEERLAIAHQGRRISMMHHRSWHRMEEIIFGRALTLCSDNPKNGDCPYIVHASETSR